MLHQGPFMLPRSHLPISLHIIERLVIQINKISSKYVRLAQHEISKQLPSLHTRMRIMQTAENVPYQIRTHGLWVLREKLLDFNKYCHRFCLCKCTEGCRVLIVIVIDTLNVKTLVCITNEVFFLLTDPFSGCKETYCTFQTYLQFTATKYWAYVVAMETANYWNSFKTAFI